MVTYDAAFYVKCHQFVTCAEHRQTENTYEAVLGYPSAAKVSIFLPSFRSSTPKNETLVILFTNFVTQNRENSV